MKTFDRPIRVAVVGLGIGSQHIAAFRAAPELFDVVAVCSLDEAGNERVAAQFGIADATTRFEALLERADIDVIDVCTPPMLHLPQARAALAAGKHVICEKPLTNSIAGVDALAEAERASGRRLMPIFQYRFGAGLQKLMRLQALDMLTCVFGPPRSVFARTATRVNPIEVEDTAGIVIEHANGALSTVSITLGSAAESTRHRLVFEGGVAESNTRAYSSSGDPWTFPADTTELAERFGGALADIEPTGEASGPGSGSSAPPLKGYTPPAGYEAQFRLFHAAMQSGAPFPVTVADARASIALLTAIYHAAETGAPVALPIASDHPKYNGWR